MPGDHAEALELPPAPGTRAEAELQAAAIGKTVGEAFASAKVGGATPTEAAAAVTQAVT